MMLKLVRGNFDETTTEGMLYVDELFQCYTLEDTDRHLEDGGVKIQNQTAIPRGTYDVTIDMSTRFGRMMPHILNVPQFDGVRIHVGNTAIDTDGCILVGTSINSQDSIAASRVAYDAFYEKLAAAINARVRCQIVIL